MTTDRRIKRLYPALSANERVILFLEDRKAGLPPDKRLGATTPPQQRPEVDRLLRDLAVANVELGSMILALNASVREEQWRRRWFNTHVAWLDDLATMREFLDVLPREWPATRNAARGRAMRGGVEALVEQGARLRLPVDLDASVESEGLQALAVTVLKGSRHSLLALAWAGLCDGADYQGVLRGPRRRHPAARGAGAAGGHVRPSAVGLR